MKNVRFALFLATCLISFGCRNRTGGSDAGGSDAGGSDAGGSDAGGSDAGGSDAGRSDAGSATAGSPAAGGAGASQPLALDFEAVDHDLSFAFVTDMKFAPGGSSTFMVTDILGGWAEMELQADSARVVTEGLIGDVYQDGAAGLVAVALDPDFAENHYFYMAMAITKVRNVVRRYTLVSGDAEATQESMVVIMDIETPGAPRWHNITSLGFEPGSEGVMWLSIGDKGRFDPAQDPTDILGSLARIIPSRDAEVGGYTTPDDAPLFSEDANPAVYAKGLRSPWKMLLHDGRWYFGDVGLNDIEEINVVDRPGLNFGWPLVEGPCELDIRMLAPEDCEERFVDPTIYYDRSTSHPFVVDDLDAAPRTQRSVYVGWIYQDSPLDPYRGRWKDVLTFGDTYLGFLRATRLDAPEASWALGHMEWTTAWAQAPDGYVYVMALAQWPVPEDGSVAPSPLWRAVLGEP